MLVLPTHAWNIHMHTHIRTSSDSGSLRASIAQAVRSASTYRRYDTGCVLVQCTAGSANQLVEVVLL